MKISNQSAFLLAIVALFFCIPAQADPRLEVRGCLFHPQYNADVQGDEPFVAGADNCVAYVDDLDVAQGLFFKDEQRWPCSDNSDGTYNLLGVDLGVGERYKINNGDSGAQCTIDTGNGATYTSDRWTSTLFLRSESGGTCVVKLELSCRNGARAE